MIDFNKVKVGDKVNVLVDRYQTGINASTIKLKEEQFNCGVTLEDDLFYTLDNLELIEDMNQEIEVGDIVSYAWEDNPNKTVVRLSKPDSDGEIKLYYKVNGEEDWGYLKGNFKLVSKAKQNMKEVIGYNIKPEFKGKVALIAKALDTHAGESSLGVWMPTPEYSSPAAKAKELGVLDLWFEPVYKSSEVVVKLSKNRTATITTKTIATVAADGNTFEVTAKNVDYTLNALNSLGQIAGYNVGVKEFNLGCQTFTIEDLIAVDKAFKEYV